MKQFKTEWMAAVVVFAMIAVVAWLCNEALEAKKTHEKALMVERTVNNIVHQVREQIIELPEDGEYWYLTLFLHDDWKQRADERRLVAWFESTPRLASLKAQTHWNVYTPAIPAWRTTWSNYKAPCVQLQKAPMAGKPGEVIYKATAENIPGNGDQLADDIATMITNKEGFRPDCRPRPKPEPDDKVPPKPDTDPDAVPDMTPDKDAEPEGEEFPWIPLGIAVIATAGWILFQHMKPRRGPM